VRRKPDPKDDLARDIRGTQRGDHVAVDDLIDLTRIQIDALQELGTDQLRQVQGGHVPERRLCLGERSPKA
jgi:hypothetical protein